ncbi:unnamed protein product [Calypogeia fissa]
MAFHVPTPLIKARSRMAALLSSSSPLFSSSSNNSNITTASTSASCGVNKHYSLSLSFGSSSSSCASYGGFCSCGGAESAPSISSSAQARPLQQSSSSSSACFASPDYSFSSISSASGGDRGYLFSSAFASPAPAASGAFGSARRAPMTTNASSATAPTDAKSVHDFTVKDINGEEVDLSKYKGKVLLIVNVASACGLTKANYTELTEIYSELKEAGLEILAFPCNQFGGQEPGSNEQIKEFACTRYKAEFPIFNKVDVNGPNTAPLYQFLKKSKGGGILGDNIKWNFGKFLVNQDGVVVERYAPTTSPKTIQGDIKKLLDSPPAESSESIPPVLPPAS